MAEEQEEESGKKSSGKKWLFIALGVLLLIVGGGAGAWFYFAGSENTATPVAETPEKRADAIYVKLRTLGGKPSFVTNFPRSEGRQRFMQVYAEAVTRDPAVAEALKSHMPMIVHKLSQLFSSQSFADIQTTAGKRQLREEATRTVQEVLQAEIGRPGIEAVYFTNLVMQ